MNYKNIFIVKHSINHVLGISKVFSIILEFKEGEIKIINGEKNNNYCQKFYIT